MEDAPSSSSSYQAAPRIPVIRNADRPLPPRPQTPRSDSSDRKRRMTPQEQGRAYPYVMNSPPLQLRHSTSRADDLAARVLPQFRPPPQQRSGPTMADLVPNVPIWQPDEDVQYCFVCGQEFTLFFRKHHCRKCGKVVCGDCSKHRITVPLRYIAQPPWAAEASSQDLEGSAPVRVCNPCVPDPWQPSNSGPQPPAYQPADRPRVALHRHTMSNPPPQMYRQMPSPSSLAPHQENDPSRHPQQIGPVVYRRRPPGMPAGLSGSLDSRLRLVSSPIHVPVPPRREVKEEDECPVCGIEMPPGEALREEHIADCVKTRFGGADAGQPASPRSPDQTQDTEGSSATPLLNRTRAQSYRSRGLYQYKATEKDCTDGDDQEQECPICFEEFQPGEILGRLECLCRFHHSCIREWWVRKGPGMCPVHASHE